MKATYTRARSAALLLMAAASVQTGGCAMMREMSDKLAGRPVLPQAQMQEAPEAQAAFIARRRPMNNPPTDGDPRYSGMQGQAMQQLPAMQAGADQAGFPMGLPPSPPSAAQAWQGGVPQAGGYMPQQAMPQQPMQPSMQQPMQQPMPQAMQGAGDPYAMQGMGQQPMQQQPMMQQQPSPFMQGAAGRAAGLSAAAGASRGTGYAPPQMQQQPAPSYSGVSYVTDNGMQAAPYGAGGNRSGLEAAAADAMPLQLDGGGGYPQGGGYRNQPGLQSDGSPSQGAPQNMYAPPPQGAANQVQDIPFAPRGGQMQGATQGMMQGQPPLAAKSRMRYAARNRTSYYGSMMGQPMENPDAYMTPPADGQMTY